MSRTMKLLVIFFVAAIAAVGGVFWFFSSQSGDVLVPVATADKVPTLDKLVAEGGTVKAGGRILVRRSTAEIKPVYVRTNGRTAPARSVELRSQSAGVVAETPVEQGRLLKVGDLVCSLESEAARLMIQEAEADLEAAQSELQNTVNLVRDGWKDPDAERSAKADVESAEANLRTAELELEKTRIRAPFNGLFELRQAEIGDLLEIGDMCGTLIELNPLLAVIQADEELASRIGPETPAIVSQTSTDGGQPDWAMSGEVRFIASAANDAGNYRVEIALPNHDMALRAGQTVDVRIATGEGLAHLVKPGAVIHAEDGSLRVRHVGVDNKIKLSEVFVHDSQLDGVWVSGLPEQALIVVEGQGDLPDGLPVEFSIENENS